MVGRTQLGAGPVALLATEWQLDLVVADQAIGHLGQVGAAHGVRGVDAAVARQAWVRAVQVGPDVARRGEILAGVDGLGDDRRHVTHLQMFFVTEVREQSPGRRRNRDALMARLARRRRWQIVILDARAVGDRYMTARTVGLQLQVEAVRERRFCSQR